jgi:F-type H+-transporting ATPase subunit c
MRFGRILVAAAAVLLFVEPAMAEEAAAAGAAGASNLSGIAAAIAICVAALGGTLGQGKVVSSALDSIARNPGASGLMTTPMFVGLAFIESLVLFALIIALKLVGIF